MIRGSLPPFALPPPRPEPAQRPSDFLPDDDWRELGAALRLSQREAQIARCVADGASEAETARRLQISKSTVHTHLERLYRKLGVGSRCMLVVRLFATYVELRGTRAPEDAATVPVFTERERVGCADDGRAAAPRSADVPVDDS